MQLRWYQTEAIQSLFDYFGEHDGNPIIALPTGTGKTAVLSGFIKRVFQQYSGQRILVLTHVKELIRQDADAMLKWWPTAPVGVYSAGLRKRDTQAPITFGGIASVAKKAADFGHVSLIIVDEAHLVSPKSDTMYAKFIDDLKQVNPKLKVIGLTATPYRLGTGMLTDGPVFTDTCYDLTDRPAFARFVKEGFIAPLIAKRTNTELDTTGVHMRGGEYILKELQEAVNKTRITQAALEEAIALGQDRKSWLVFTTGIAHTEDTTKLLNAMGVRACAVHSKMAPAQRDENIAKFKAGYYRACVNANVLTTGFDHPEVDMEIILRPTVSTGLWVQVLGRGTRPAPGKKDCLVLDFAGNTRKLGPIDDPVIPKKKGDKGDGTAPIKVCEQCGTYNHASVRFCVYCGFEFHRESKLKATASTEAVMGAAKPEIILFPVDRVIYRKHAKLGKVPSLKVTYHCGLQFFHEWICLEHDGFPKRQAHSWWKRVSELDPPETVDSALSIIDSVKPAKGIRVWINKKYPEVMHRIYSPLPAMEQSLNAT